MATIVNIEGGKNLFDDPVADMLVVAVNTVGVMGAGQAKEFARRFPTLVDAYKLACKQRLLSTKRIYHFYYFGGIANGRKSSGNEGFVFFATKEHWRDPSKYEYIYNGLQSLKATVLNENRVLHSIKSIAFPKLGCGLGGLEWHYVKAMIVRAFEDVDITLRLYGEEKTVDGDFDSPVRKHCQRCYGPLLMVQSLEEYDVYNCQGCHNIEEWENRHYPDLETEADAMHRIFDADPDRDAGNYYDEVYDNQFPDEPLPFDPDPAPVATDDEDDEPIPF